MTFLPMFTTTDTNNFCLYSNPEYDELVDKAQLEMDPGKAVAIMIEAEDVLMGDYPFIPTFHNSYKFLMKPNVKGFVIQGGSLDNTCMKVIFISLENLKKMI